MDSFVECKVVKIKHLSKFDEVSIKVNKFPRMVEITRKDMLYKHIARMQSSYGMRYFDFVPKSFILPQDSAIF